MGAFSEIDIKFRELAEQLDELLKIHPMTHSVDPDRNELYQDLKKVREDFRKTGYLD